MADARQPQPGHAAKRHAAGRRRAPAAGPAHTAIPTRFLELLADWDDEWGEWQDRLEYQDPQWQVLDEKQGRTVRKSNILLIVLLAVMAASPLRAATDPVSWQQLSGQKKILQRFQGDWDQLSEEHPRQLRKGAERWRPPEARD